MSKEDGYKIRDKQGVHFVTFAVVEWVDVFTRRDYCNILLESIKFCQAEKGMELYAWCLMSNHIHLVFSAKNNNPSEILRDFKKFTGQQIMRAIQMHPTESRKEWMLEVFSKAGKKNTRNKNFQFWRQDNRPIVLLSPYFIHQKLTYIHNNPVEAGLVDKPEDYCYSSARDYEGKSGLLKVRYIGY